MHSFDVSQEAREKFVMHEMTKALVSTQKRKAVKRKIKEIYIHIVIEEKRCFNASFNYPNDYPQAYYGMQYLSRCLTKHQSQTKDFVLC